MKKIIRIGIASLMAISMGGVANASATAWTLLVKAGSTPSMSAGSAGIVQLGIAATASSSSLGSVTSTQAGFYSTDVGTGVRGAKDIRVNGQLGYYWHLKLETGNAWSGPVYIGWNFPSSALADNRMFAVYRQGCLVATIQDSGSGYSASTFNSLGSFDVGGAGMIEDWQITTCWLDEPPPPGDTPEPGSIIVMLSGIAGLAGYGIKRRK